MKTRPSDDAPSVYPVPPRGGILRYECMRLLAEWQLLPRVPAPAENRLLHYLQGGYYQPDPMAYPVVDQARAHGYAGYGDVFGLMYPGIVTELEEILESVRRGLLNDARSVPHVRRLLACMSAYSQAEAIQLADELLIELHGVRNAYADSIAVQDALVEQDHRVYHETLPSHQNPIPMAALDVPAPPAPGAPVIMVPPQRRPDYAHPVHTLIALTARMSSRRYRVDRLFSIALATLLRSEWPALPGRYPTLIRLGSDHTRTSMLANPRLQIAVGDVAASPSPPPLRPMSPPVFMPPDDVVVPDIDHTPDSAPTALANPEEEDTMLAALAAIQAGAIDDSYDMEESTEDSSIGQRVAWYAGV